VDAEKAAQSLYPTALSALDLDSIPEPVTGAGLQTETQKSLHKTMQAVVTDYRQSKARLARCVPWRF
jgi:hypothetical protein